MNQVQTIVISYTATIFLFMTSSVFGQPLAKFQVVPLTAGMHVIKAEVALNMEQRRQGLMYREKMGNNEGMMFLFGAPAQADASPRICMWMKNTLIPLSVAFIDGSGKIINIENMTPQTTDEHCAKKPELVRYALEMNLGWFKQKNIKPGSVIAGLPHPQ